MASTKAFTGKMLALLGVALTAAQDRGTLGEEELSARVQELVPLPRIVMETRVLISGTRRGLTPKLIADLRRRSAIEAEIGHMKTDGRLSRCPLKGLISDALFAVLCACGRNIHKFLAQIRS